MYNLLDDSPVIYQDLDPESWCREGRGDLPPQDGMTLRDWFAGMALQGIMARGVKDEDTSLATYKAYVAAEAMLVQRSRSPDEFPCGG